MSRLHSAGLAVALLLTPFAAGARQVRVGDEAVRVDTTWSTYANAHTDPGNGEPVKADYQELFSRLNFQFGWRSFSAGLRLDTSWFFDTPQVGERLAKANCATCEKAVTRGDLNGRFPLRLYDARKGVEKVSLGWRGRNVEVMLGDSYVQFGRGLVLALRKADELGQDTTLFGGRATVRAGEFSATAVGGLVNAQNVDEATALFVPDPDDALGGVRLQYRFFERVVAAANVMAGVPAQNASLLQKTSDRYLRWGASAEAPRLLKWLSAYAEYARADDRQMDAARTGGALYASATAFHGRSTWLLELKDYRNYRPWSGTKFDYVKVPDINYQLPPTLERVNIPVTNNADVTASRLRWDFRKDAHLSFFGSVLGGELRSEKTPRNLLGGAYGGAEIRLNGTSTRLAPVVEYRRQQEAGTGKLAERLLSFEWEALQAFGGGWSAEANGFVWLREKWNYMAAAYEDWAEGIAYLALKRSPRFSVQAGWEFTSEPSERLHRQHFFNGAVGWNITGSTGLRFFAGGVRGGLRCTSNGCGYLPPFQGVKLELVIRD